MRIGIDLDVTLIDSPKSWFEWLQCMCGGDYEFTPWPYFKEKIIKEKGQINYNLAAYFPEPKNKNVDVKNWWRGDTTYDTVKAVKGGVEAVTELSKYHDIVFISALKGNHHKSKHCWLKRHFDFDFGFVGTQEKELINVDVMIDDRVCVLNRFDKSVTTIRYDSPYLQTEEPTREHYVAETWEDVLKIILT